MAENEDLKLDKENYEFNKASEFVLHTDKLIYLTGKAGTGKTTFLKHIKDVSKKNTVILAPTGVAAINAGGVTINSFFQIPFGPFLPDDSRLRTKINNTESNDTIYNTFKYNEDRRRVIENLELLIIDEISMVRCDMLDVIDKILRVFRKKSNLAFGGVQVILIGDTFQLPPISNYDEWSILSRFYKTPFFFSSRVIEQNKLLYIELKKIYRQKEQEFIDLLNRVRVNKVNSNDFSILNSKYNPDFSSKDSDYIILATHNRIVNETNIAKLNKLETDIFTFEAKVSKVFPDKIIPTDRFLKLKIGAQIMFVKNDDGAIKRYYNGKIGTIKELEANKIVVVFDDDQKVEVKKTEWKNIKYTYKGNKIKEDEIGTFEQYPIKLAWAITVHKSQGLTFEKVIADLGGAFASGQVYVALSRCTSFNGLVLKSKLHQNAIKTDINVLEFAKKETPSTLIAEELSTGKADLFYKNSREHFNSGHIDEAFTLLKKALKFRNDIETDVFERFILIYYAKIFSYKNKFSLETTKTANLQATVDNQAEIIDNKETKINELNNYLTKKIVNLEAELAIVSETDIEQKNKISIINNELGMNKIYLSELENKERLKQIEIKRIKNISKNLNIQIIQERAELYKDIEIKAKENKRLEIEILRLKNLKWYDKILGRK